MDLNKLRRLAGLPKLSTLKENADWSDDVEPKTHSEEGTFTKSAEDIVHELMTVHEGDAMKALEALNFYINRAGEDVTNKEELEKAKHELEGKLEVMDEGKDDIMGAADVGELKVGDRVKVDDNYKMSSGSASHFAGLEGSITGVFGPKTPGDLTPHSAKVKLDNYSAPQSFALNYLKKISVTESEGADDFKVGDLVKIEPEHWSEDRMPWYAGKEGKITKIIENTWAEVEIDGKDAGHPIHLNFLSKLPVEETAEVDYANEPKHPTETEEDSITTDTLPEADEVELEIDTPVETEGEIDSMDDDTALLDICKQMASEIEGDFDQDELAQLLMQAYKAGAEGTELEEPVDGEEVSSEPTEELDEASDKPYYSLLQKQDGEWTIQFGAFERSDVVAEYKDLMDHGSRSADLKIIKTGDSQAEIETAVAKLNAGTAVEEMASPNDFSSGFQKSAHARSTVDSFKRGSVTYDLSNGDSYTGDRTIPGNKLEAGMTVLASYNQVNQGARVYEIIGFTGDEQKYGEGGVKFTSVKEMLDHYQVGTLAELEEKQDEQEYGHSSYMVLKDLEDGDEGPFFYIFKGAWVQGSGAERLSFTLAKKIDTPKAEVEESEEIPPANGDVDVRDLPPGTSVDHNLWPDKLFYKGHNVFNTVYDKNDAKFQNEISRNISRNRHGYDLESVQECFLGYIPKLDKFILGYDGWGDEVSDPKNPGRVKTEYMSPYFLFTIDDTGNVYINDYKIAGNDQMWYDQEGGYRDMKKMYPDLISIRLD